jgi:hypothetical protein
MSRLTGNETLEEELRIRSEAIREAAAYTRAISLRRTIRERHHAAESLSRADTRQPRRENRSAGPVSRRRARPRARSPGRLADDDPHEPDLLDRPLKAAERRWLKQEVDRRRREVLAARPEVTPRDLALFDEDRA